MSEATCSSYKQYKADTNFVTTWIVQSAKKYKCPPHLIPKKQPLDPNIKATADASAKIPVDSFVALTNFIVKREPAIKIPKIVLDTLGRAIRTRRKHTQLLQRHLRKVDEDKNSSHGYFNEILEHVQEILDPRRGEAASTSSERPNSDESKTSAKTPGNQFEGLKVEHPSPSECDQPDQEPIYSLPSVSNEEWEKKGKEWAVDHSKDEMECIFAMLALIDEITIIRRELCSAWTIYKHGFPNAIPAALATNVAIDLIRRLEIGFFVEFPEKSASELMCALLDAQCRYQGKDCGETLLAATRAICHPSKRDPNTTSIFDSEDRDNRVYTILNSSMALTYACMEEVQGSIGFLPTEYWDTWNAYDLSEDRAEMNDQDKIFEDVNILKNSILQLITFINLQEGLSLGDDELMKALHVLMKGQLHLWSIFAMQTLLDSFHVLRNEVNRPFRELQSYRLEAILMVRVSREFQNVYCNGVYRVGMEGVKDLVSRIGKLAFNSVDIDSLRKVTKKEFPSLNKLDRTFIVLKHYPLRCGGIVAALKSYMQELGILSLNLQSSVLYAIHLYNLLRLTKTLETRIDDLELALAVHGAKGFFIGGRLPTTASEAHVSLNLGQGISLQNHALDNRSARRQASKEKSPSLQIFKRHTLTIKDSLTPLMDIFMNTLKGRRTKCRPSWDLKSVKRILDSHKSIFEFPLDAFLISPSEQRSIIETTGRVSDFRLSGETSNLLHVIITGFHYESVMLNIDHLALHRTCWRILKQVETVCTAGQSLRTFQDTAFQAPCIVNTIISSYRHGVDPEASTGGLERNIKQEVERRLREEDKHRPISFRDPEILRKVLPAFTRRDSGSGSDSLLYQLRRNGYLVDLDTKMITLGKTSPPAFQVLQHKNGASADAERKASFRFETDDCSRMLQSCSLD